MSDVRINDTAAVARARRNLSFALESFAMEVWSEAKRNHAFTNRTGELEKSIRVERVDEPTKVIYKVLAGVGFSAGPSSVGGAIGRAGSGGSSKAYYALYVEMGTKRNRAYPFLRPALFNKQQQFIPLISRILQDLYL